MLDQDDRRDLQQLHKKWNRSQHADREVAGAEFDGKAGEKNAGGQRPHGFARQAIVEDMLERPLGVECAYGAGVLRGFKRSNVVEACRCMMLEHLLWLV